MVSTRGSGPVSAATRQASVVFVLAGLVTIAHFSTSSLSSSVVAGIAGAHFVMAGTAWLLPRDRWLAPTTAGLGLVAIVLLSVSTWALDGYGAGLGPLFVLLFGWLGLHQPYRLIVAAVPLAAAGYAGAMLAADAPTRLVASTLVVFPIAAVVALLIRQTVRLLRETQQLLEVKDRWRAALMATLAHDVRSPLSSVLGTLEILEDDPGIAAMYRPLITAANRQTNRVLHLAFGILEVERVEQGMLRLDRHAVDLAEVAHEVALLTQVEHVVVDVPDDFTVLADRDRLEQVLYNLTSNALRHGRAPIVISASDIGGRTEIHVRDHGDGVPPAEVGNLFDRFSSADHSPHSVGLGLWIVKLLVQAHDGTVHYESADPGARFVVTLPKEEATAPVASPLGARLAQAARRS